MKDNNRKCIKCGASGAQDPELILHRFPKPGPSNLQRMGAWAKFCFPEENWNSFEFQKKLYTSHKMLCSKHFSKDSYLQDHLLKDKLHRYAVPSESITTSVHISPVEILVPTESSQQPGTSSTSDVKSETCNKEKLLLNKCQRNLRKICNLQKRIRKLKKQQILEAVLNDKAVQELSANLTNSFAVLLQGQLLNCKRKKQGRRWNLTQKIISLRLYKRSPACYRLLRRLFSLPSQTTLKNLLNRLPLKPGINQHLFDVIKKMADNNTPEDNEYCLLFDEMSIRKTLNYNKKSDQIDGFQDHGEEQGRNPQVASHALVFMITGIRKKIKQPVAYYLSGDHVTADRLTVLIKEDLKTFAENDFDTKKWINNAWNSCEDQEKEVFVANAVGRLQLYMKQLTNSLDEATSQIVTSLPKVLREASALHEAGSVLRQKLLTLELKVHGVEQQTGHSIQSLQRIDNLKSKLENAALTLREADKWDALTSSLEAILESGVPDDAERLDELARQVASMTHSLELMSDASDYDTRRVQLETLYNRLEAAVSAPFIRALTLMDAERTGLYVRVCDGMGRRGGVARGWRRAAGARLAAAWRAAPRHTLPALAHALTAAAPPQVAWLTDVLKLPNPLAELIRLYTDLLVSLEPSPTKIVTASLKLCSSPEEGLALLAEVRTDLDQLVAGLQAVLHAADTRTEASTESLMELWRVVYSPLREVLPRYAELQAQELDQLLAAHVATLPPSSELVGHARGLQGAVQQCARWTGAAYARSLHIAGAAAYPAYCDALQRFVDTLSGLISAHWRRAESEFLSSVSGGAASGGGGGGGVASCGGGGGGVLSAAFGAALVLAAAAADLLAAFKDAHRADNAPPLSQQGLPLEQLLLEAEGRRLLEAARAAPPPCGALQQLRDHLTTLATNILQQPINTQLEKVPHLSVWSNNDALTSELPDFALAPQEYITEVGQYLMTLPQHLELHLSDTQAPWHFLPEVCSHACELYAAQILSIQRMDPLGTKRCLTDIQYLSSVVEELGATVTPALRSLERSLRAAQHR